MSDVDERSLEQRDADKIKDLEEFEWIESRRVEQHTLDINQELRDRTIVLSFVIGQVVISRFTISQVTRSNGYLVQV